MSTDTLLPEAPPDVAASAGDALYEVVNGELVEQPEMGIYSNLIAGEIFFLLRLHLATHRLGTAAVEALVILDAQARLRRRPDVCFVSADRWPLERPVPDSGDWDVVPDLAIEVASPNDTLAGVYGKIRGYFEHGVQRVWLVVPEEQQVHVYTSPTQVTILKGDQTLRDDELLPGFELRLADVLPPREVTASHRKSDDDWA